MGESQAPEPDITFSIQPEYGGQSGVEGLYSSGAAELIVEVAISSRSRDFGAKKRLYERVGVREYALRSDGIFRSGCFPGLWLDTKALWDVDRPRRNAALEQGLATPEHANFVTELVSRKH